MNDLQGKSPKLLVIGDLMIDHYLWGSCERISPEAPVQVVNIKSESAVLGGAGNVVNTYIDLITNPPLGEILNICTEKTFSIKEIVDKCEKITNHKMEIKINPKLCRANDAIRLVGNGQYLKKFIKSKNTFSFDDTLKWMLL